MASIQFNRQSVEYIQATLGGTAVGTAYPARKFKAGTVLFDSTAGVFYQRTGGASAPTWSTLSGAGGGLSTKYWVNNSSAGPTLGYSTLTAALAAYTADGHNGSNPATIMVMPGTYAESVTVPAGASIFGVTGSFSNGPSGSVIISGDVSLSGTTGRNTFSNILIIGSMFVQAAASQPIEIVLVDSYIAPSADDALVLNANNVSVFASGSSIQAPAGKTAFRCNSTGNGYNGELNNCYIRGGSGATGLAAELIAGPFRFVNCDFSVTGAATRLIQAYSATHAVTATFRDCAFWSEDANAATTNTIQDTGNGTYIWEGAATAFYKLPANRTLFGGAGTPTATARGGPHMGAFVKANLPTISANDMPAFAYASDGTKATAAATGVPVYRDPGTNAWLTTSGDVAP